MKKSEAYHSILSIHCQWKKGTEECLTYEQSFHYRTLHRVSQFGDWYEDKTQFITIQQRVQQCLQHFVTQISWLCRHISGSWKAVSVCERFTWPCHWLETETTAFIQKAILNVSDWTQCTEGISRQCNEGRYHTQVISSAALSVMFMLKSDSSLQLVINYRHLNSITIKNHYSLSLISNILNCFQGAQKFTKLNCKNAYNQIRIKGEVKWKTVFWTQFRLFKYLIMLFDLTNASAIF